ncbi:16S rRNA (cytosine(967)-C(5))-methyltransferase RsmB [Clostridium sp.]|uniref:16S rRNA (cytosine(967)-C(5))-methyltransferase RsmB n=1 Tax=Clostridium sp. TaxID=1506 RepID=UPI002A917998|nr:16S rRNA (cytosine(967)-C(5))-methyltransferase RsmB [Clostridium sp.]MDY6012870.1 16S rRNA (cytosine(967)-C(5))-methyltransferase RsmB [Clostridium sp.]
MNSRSIALKILNRVFNEGAYSNLVLSSELNNSNLNDKDKALVTEIVYGTIRRKNSLDTLIASFVRDIKMMDKRVLNILRIAMYQLKFLDKVPSYAACNEAVEQAKKISISSSKLVNGILRSYGKKGESGLVFKNKIYELAYTYSFEPWLIRLFIKQYGEEDAIRILNGLNLTPKVTVRVNSLKGDFDEVFEELEEFGYNVEEGYICPEAISIKGGKSVEDNKVFNEGKITVQDESAMLVAPLLDIAHDEIVLDLCSAPGGKTTHIAELLENTGKVLAFDLHKNKLGLIEENCKRLGIKNVELKQMDATKIDVNLIGAGDKILLDVPCSGLGIIKRKPEIKWNKNREELKEIVKVQREIMENAWQYLKQGGTMVYSTCTLNKEENEQNIEWFLNKHKNCTLEKVFIGNGDNLRYENGMLTVLPNEYMDGFFIAKLKKI